MFDVQVVAEYWPIFLRGTVLTLYVSTIATVLGLGLGLIVALMRVSRVWVGRGLARAYVELIRGTPLLVQLYIVYFGLPEFGIRLGAITSGVIAMSLYMGAYAGEIIRAGILSIQRGHVEAARSLGMTHIQAVRRIVLPLMASLVLPALANEFTSLIKWSAVLSIVTVPELTYSAQQVIAATFSPVEAFVTITVLYWGINDLFVHVARRLEKRAVVYS